MAPAEGATVDTIYNQVHGDQKVHGDQIFNIRNDNQEPSISLPIVYEARFDSKDLEESPKCHADTRTGVRFMVRSWVNDPDAMTLLWLHAPAGTGKSTLARTLVHDFKDEKQLAAGYFFKRGHDLRNDTCRVFSTIASQLIETIPRYESALGQSLRNSMVDGIEKMSLEKQFETLVYKPLAGLEPENERFPMIIIIDAVDECACPRDIPLLLEKFASLGQLKAFRLCVFFSSRRTPPIRHAIGNIPAIKANCRVVALHEEFVEATRSEMEVVLRDGLTDIKRRRSITLHPWPESEQFDIVLGHATDPSPLFVYVSTLLRYIDKRNPKRRLENWISNCPESVSQLDQIYMPVMEGILRGEEDDGTPEPLNVKELTGLRHVLGSLVLLARPLSATALSGLLQSSENGVQEWLKALHAVVHVPDDNESPIELIHKSFADFLLGEDGTGTHSFRIDPAEIHGVLAERCVSRLMTKRHMGLRPEGLHKNLCELDEPTALADEIEKDKIADSIPEDLAYACVYWVHHLVESKKTVDREKIYSLLRNHFLHWLEALSLLRRLPEGGAAIRQLLDFILTQGYPDTSEDALADLLRDAQKFMREHGTRIQEYPLQTYSACLVLSDPQNKVKQLSVESQETRIASIKSIRGGIASRRALMSEFRIGHRFSQIAISPDGCLVAAGTYDRLCVVDIATGIVIQSTPFETNPINFILALSFSVDQKSIIVVTNEKGLYIWDTTGSHEQPTLQCELVSSDDYFQKAAISAKFSLIATMGDHSLHLWDSKTGDHRQTITNKVLNDAVAITLNVTSQTDWRVGLINMSGGIYLLTGHERAEPAILFVGDHPLPPHRVVPKVAISPCGNLLASGAPGEIRVWAWNEGNVSHQHTLKYGDSYVGSLAIFPRSNMLAVGGEMLSIFGIPTQFTDELSSEPQSLPDRNCIVSSTLFDHNEQLCGAASRAHYAHIPNPGRVIRMALDPTGQTLVTFSRVGQLLVWDLKQGSLRYDIRCGMTWPPCLAICSGGHMLAIEVTMGEVHFWKLENSTATLQDQKVLFHSPIYSSRIDFSPNSKWLVTSTLATLGLWDVATGRRQWCLEDFESLRPWEHWDFSSDASTLAVVSDHEAAILDVRTGHCQNILSWRKCLPSTWYPIVTNIHFSADDESVGIRILDRFSWNIRFLLWVTNQVTVETVDPIAQSKLQSNRVYSSIFYERFGHAQWMIHGSQLVWGMSGNVGATVVAGDRLVIAQGDGEFIVVDFDSEEVDKI